MKNVKFFLGVLFVVLLASCSNELVDINQTEVNAEIKTLDVFGQIVEQKNGILCFQNMEDLESACMSLEKAQYTFADNARGLDLEQKEVSIENQGFRSMYDVFDEAMEEAPKFYDKKENYEIFKAKYSSLYFPEVGDDYAAYLPISDKNLAKLANEEGFIKVNGELIDCKDIKDYDTLVELGLTPPNEMLRSKEVFYHKEGDNKLWVNFSTEQTINSKPFYESGLKFEVCFRDKGFMGIWYNRKASTTIQCALCDLNTMQGASNVGNYVKYFKNDSFSSHDYSYNYRVFTSGGNDGFIVNLTFGPWPGKVFTFTIEKEE